MNNFSAVQPIDKEVETGTDATISCVISGITKQLDKVEWKLGGNEVTSISNSDYVVDAGTYSSNSQTSTLTVKAARNTADQTFSCFITSNEWLQIDKETSVVLNVFCTFQKILLTTDDFVLSNL